MSTRSGLGRRGSIRSMGSSAKSRAAPSLRRTATTKTKTPATTAAPIWSFCAAGIIGLGTLSRPAHARTAAGTFLWASAGKADVRPARPTSPGPAASGHGKWMGGWRVRLAAWKSQHSDASQHRARIAATSRSHCGKGVVAAATTTGDTTDESASAVWPNHRSEAGSSAWVCA